ncbi:MAG TPA: endonuclease/exonuclease/phosphatase family protein [Afifellaceae bacterium]|nr:endonuclease/exonuclease/phosphatase family protein [Afifellaceae bacterium]
MAAWLITAAAAFLVTATFLPFLALAHGIVRVCDFPRVQIAVMAALLAALALWLVEPAWWAWAVASLLAASVAVQAGFILPFTPLWRIQSLAWDGAPDDPATVRILVCNVKQSNRQYGRLVHLVQREDPDIVVLAETDHAWLGSLADCKEAFLHRVEQPQDNTYGMLLFSKLPLHHARVRYLLLDEVPSIQANVELRDGRRFNLIALHPEPPMPYADTLGRDAEIVLAAKLVEEDPLPSIVTGDLNDVAWSRTNRRFQRLSRLLDPRRGRGRFSTFHASYPFLRWPLDHLFHDPAFRLVEMRVLPHVGSDHFPIFFALALADHDKAGGMPEEADREDRAEARRVVRRGAELERDPIGTDWED